MTDTGDFKSLSHWKKWPCVLHIFAETSDYCVNRPTEHIGFLVHCGTSELIDRRQQPNDRGLGEVRGEE